MAPRPANVALEPSPRDLGYAGAWVAAFFAATLLVFQRRDVN